MIDVFLPLVEIVSVSRAVESLPELSVMSILDAEVSLSDTIPIIILIPAKSTSIILVDSKWIVVPVPYDMSVYDVMPTASSRLSP